ncbi:MAG: hypothetical protein MI742_14015, partial [Desulfobacterales bacterium]|nr:hypothetical protein [Desulfobacterales bacterium]
MGGSIKGVLFLAVVVGCILTKGVGFALEPLSDEALDETHAASGIRFDIDSLYMNYSADELGFITHENLPAYWGSPTSPYWKPTESDYRYGKLYAQNVLASNIKVDGSLTLESGVFPFAAQSYAVRDTWKNESGNMAFKRQKYIHDIDPIYTLTATLPEFNARNRDVIRITMAPGSGSSVVELGSMAGQLFVDYSENNNQGASATTEALARLGIDGVRLIDQQMMLYPLADIPKYSGSNELYASGEGVAFELGMRLSIDAIGLRSPGYVAPSGSSSWAESHKGDLVLKGIHLRESFNDPWIIDAYNDSSWPSPPSKYDYFGRITRINGLAWISSSDIANMYAYGTGDSGGYQTGDESKLFSANNEILSQWRGTALDPDVVDRMYGGRFMLGNLRQIHFHDYIAGNGEIAFHENHSNQIDHPGMSDDVNGENPIDRQNGKS